MKTEKTLVLNCGSSSIKFALFSKDTCLGRGAIERIKLKDSEIHYTALGGKKVNKVTDIKNHNQGIEIALNLVLEQTPKLLDFNQIKVVGHRYANAAEVMMKPAVINNKVLRTLEDCASYAPLHNPFSIDGIKAAKKLLPKAKQVVSFDTSFFSNMKEEAYLYGIPYRLYSRYHIRRFGFHGASHEYVANEAAHFLKKPLKSLKIVSCHLGSGASISAIDKGQGIESSLGFTPCDGVVMGTRCGSLDPLTALYIMKKEALSIKEMEDLLMKESGLKGISGLSSDMEDLRKAALKGHKRAKLAIDVWVHHNVRLIGSKIAVMNGVDVLIFTAGIGEHFHEGREKICEKLSFLGLSIDKRKNRKKLDGTTLISMPRSKVKVLVIPTDEELIIAREARATS